MELNKEDWHHEANFFKNIMFKWKIILKHIKDNDEKFTNLEDSITDDNLNINNRRNHFNLNQGIGSSTIQEILGDVANIRAILFNDDG